VRDAGPADAAQLAAIYAHYVLHEVGTFEEEPPDGATLAERMWTGIAAGGHWLVAVAAARADGGAGEALGFAYYGPYRTRSAYRYTVEDSVYVRADVRGTGIGTTLLTALVEHATAAGFRQMVAAIGGSDNIGSTAVHARLGFAEAGVLRGVGHKFGRTLDVVLMQRALVRG